MKTVCRPATDDVLSLAARIIRGGGLVAFPTETVYGLGADALNEQAVQRIYRVKGRPPDNPLIVHVSSADAARRICDFNDTAGLLAEAFWPGPLTLILPRKPNMPAMVSAGLPTVAVRMPSHPAALRLLETCGTPVAAPSANLSGRPSPTEASHVLDDLDGLIPLIIDGGPCDVGLESTVLDLTERDPVVLRPGAVTPEQVARLCGRCFVAGGAMRPLGTGETAPSPGMLHRHYAPVGKMTLFKGHPERVASAIRKVYDRAANACILALVNQPQLYGNRRTLYIGPDPDQAAQQLYHALRMLDDNGIERILCEAPPDEGVGLAVLNRLLRASAFDLVDTDKD